MGYMYMAYTRGQAAEAPSGAVETSLAPLMAGAGAFAPSGMAVAEAPMEQSVVRGTRVWKHAPKLPEPQVEAA